METVCKDDQGRRWHRSVEELKANRTVSKAQKEMTKQMLKELGL